MITDKTAEPTVPTTTKTVTCPVIGIYEGVTKEQLEMAISMLEQWQTLKLVPQLDSPALNDVLSNATRYVMNVEAAFKYQSKGGHYGGIP